MNDAGMNGGLEAGELPAHMDTTDDLVPTLDVRKRNISSTFLNQQFDLGLNTNISYSFSQQLEEELSTDILNDVLFNSNKVDNGLTWL